MASQDILRKLEEEATHQAQALELAELYYSVEDAAKILGISRAKMYHYLKDEDFQIDWIKFDNDRKKYVLADDIRRLYIILHTPFLNSKEKIGHSPPRAPEPPRVQSAGEAAILRHMVVSH